MRKIMIAAALVVTGCTTPAQPGTSGGVIPSEQVQANRQFDLKSGQEAHVQGTPISVRFLGVGEDSRCPSDVVCVWAGNAVVRLSLTSTQASWIDAALNTTLDPKNVTYGGYTIRLVDLKPVPKSGTKIVDADYVATLEVTT